MLEKSNKTNLLKVNEVAKLFCVHPDTIRRWESKGLLAAIRHPMNKYRLFRFEDVQRLLEGLT